MGLLRPKCERNSATLKMRTATVVTCPYNGHQTGWCRALCTPVDGLGHCGRFAPHAMMGRTQRAIAAQMALQR
jgi:hypothetical protein